MVVSIKVDIVKKKKKNHYETKLVRCYARKTRVVPSAAVLAALTR
jgi:hypothetical protein